MSALLRITKSRFPLSAATRRSCNRLFSSSSSTIGIEMQAKSPKFNRRFLYGVAGFFVVSGAVCTACYAGVAYYIDDIEASLEQSIQNLEMAKKDPSFLMKFEALKMTVEVKALKAYLEFRKLYDVHVKVLPDEHPMREHALTLVLDLNETLVYSGWTGGNKGWVTVKRPGVDSFLRELSQSYEIVIFSDQLRMYVDPVVDKLDPNHLVKYRLSRFDMKYKNGKRCKDFARLHRDPKGIIYLTAYANDRTNMHPENTLQVQPWKGTPGDNALIDLIPFLLDVANAKPTDVRVRLAAYRDGDRGMVVGRSSGWSMSSSVSVVVDVS